MFDVALIVLFALVANFLFNKLGLPGILGMTLGIAGVEGIIGNKILMERTLGYFPRRRLMVLS